MKKVLVAYFSNTGNTEKIAQYIAEGVRIAGHDADLKRIADIGGERGLAGYDGYIFGCPTYHLDMPDAFKAFLSSAKKAGLEGKVGGAFSSRTHPSSGSTNAASRLFDLMESQFNMRMTNLGPFELEAGLPGSTERMIDSMEGIHTCQDYGKSVGEMLDS